MNLSLYALAARILILACMLWVALWPLAPELRVEGQDFIEDVISRMSVEDKVGQLFIVTFRGSDAGPGTDIARLIQEYRVGGVFLRAENGNFVNDENAPRQVAELTNTLQRLALTSRWELTGTVPFTTSQPLVNAPPYIPLFIAINHEGDGYPYTSLRAGLTPLPSNMALGATWKDANAEEMGRIVGKEMRALGINMLLGPSLDVLDTPRPGMKGDLGVRTFGGDPYWVGRFGQAYIRGVHEGSGERVVTVAKHFPGLGASDRIADEEIATVPKSLQELKKIELAPFFAVTRLDKKGPLPSTTDALMSSHIRYRGFQGNIRQLTRPISFDAQNLQALLNEPELKLWREQGGVMVTYDLGVPAVRRYYDPQLLSFPHKRIAQETFLAGNDLLLLSRFALNDDWSQEFENIKDTIRFFQEKYTSDPTFQARVDESLRRILHLKYKIYRRFSLGESLVDVRFLAEELGQGKTAPIAQEAVTLIYPELEELSKRLPGPPLIDEDILIFTDDRQGRDCPNCLSFPFIETDALEKVMLQLYGPKASGQVDPAHIHSLPFSQLRDFLAASESESSTPGPPRTPSPPPRVQQIEKLLQEAEWILFAMLDVNPGYPASDVVKLFLRQRSDSLRGKNVIVMAYGAPYYLDTTEISKLTAYYCVYGKTRPLIEASVRALFQEFRPQSSPPVSVGGINYDLIARLEPDPDQIIGLEAISLNEEGKGTPSTLTPAPLSPELGITLTPVGVKVGGKLQVRTGLILDRNGHPVPDGTPAVFRLFYPAESLELPRYETTTVNGVAEMVITLEKVGQLEITATSGPASRSSKLLATIQGANEPATISTVWPTLTATSIPTETPLQNLTPVTAPTPYATPESERRAEKGGMNESDLLASGATMILAGLISYTIRQDWRFSPTRRVRLFLLSLIWGLVGYILYSFLFSWRLPGHWEAPVVCFLFAFIPLGYSLARQVSRRRL